MSTDTSRPDELLVLLGCGALLLLAGLVAAVRSDGRGRYALLAIGLGSVLILGGGIWHLTRSGTCETGAPQAGCGSETEVIEQ